MKCDWCYQTSERKKNNRTKDQLHLLPVWVGPHPNNKIPTVLQQNDVTVSDLAAGDNESLLRLLGDMNSKLGSASPRVVPAALFAMTQQQFDGLFNPQPPAALMDLCVAHGMPYFPGAERAQSGTREVR